MTQPTNDETTLFDRVLNVAGLIGIGPMASVSIYSRALRLAGHFLGDPARHGMPDGFYNLQGERGLPKTTQCNDGVILRDRFAVDTYRRQLTWNASIWLAILTFLTSMAWLGVFALLMSGSVRLAQAGQGLVGSYVATPVTTAVSSMSNDELTSAVMPLANEFRAHGVRELTAHEAQLRDEYSRRVTAHLIAPLN